MEKTISAAEANRQFSQLLRAVREGDSYVVTAHGRPVAKIVPVNGEDAIERAFREKAKEALLEHLRAQPTIDVGPWTRNELYDETL